MIEITRIERFPGMEYDRRLAVQNALKKLGQPYDLINYNCQHYANEIQHGRVESDQVNNIMNSLFIKSCFIHILYNCIRSQ